MTARVFDFPMPNVDLDEYRSHLTGRGLHEKTIKAYVSALRRADADAKRLGFHLARLTPDQVRSIADGWPLSYSSKRHLRTALIQWWEMVGVQGCLSQTGLPALEFLPQWIGTPPVDPVARLKGWECFNHSVAPTFLPTATIDGISDELDEPSPTSAPRTRS